MKRYVDTVRIAENRRHVRFMGFNIKRNEYLCPLCETIGNTVMPLFPDLRELGSHLNNNTSNKSPTTTSMSEESSAAAVVPDNGGGRKRSIDLSYDDWLDCLEKTLENSIKKELHDDKGTLIYLLRLL